MESDLFFGTSGPRNAEIAIVGEAWGADEARAQRPFVGESGKELNRMLGEAGIDRERCFCTNIVPERPPGNDMWRFFYSNAEVKANKVEGYRALYPKENVRRGLDRLNSQLNRVAPRLVVLCGNYPLWALTDAGDVENKKPLERNPDGWSGKIPAGITKWRGSMLKTLDGVPALPIYHPAGILRNWATRAVTVHDLKLRVPLALNDAWEKPEWTRVLGTELLSVIHFLDKLLHLLEKGPVLGSTDIETKKGCIASLGISVDGHTALAIPFIKPTTTGLTNWWSLDEEVLIVKLLRKILHHPNYKRIGQNWIYDTQYLSHWWRIEPDVDFDTMLAQHLLFPGSPKALYYLASIYCRDYYAFWKEDSNEWEGDLDIDRLLYYNCDDVIYTWRVAKELRAAIEATNNLERYSYLLETWFLAVEMMQRGIAIDKKVRSDMSIRVMEEAQDRIDFLCRVVPECCLPPVGRTAKPWYSSAKQQQRLFYEMMGCKSIHHRKTGNITANTEALEELKIRYPELTQVLDSIIELRSLGVFQNNFLSAAIDPDDRMRCSFNPAGTETLRWSSSENAFGRGTNLQNIPKGDE
jgi:uracil-DNA glycosylase